VAGKTPNYGLAFFDFRDRLDSTLSVKMEIDRFLTIDKQLYGMYSIFGNGVVTGLQVRKSFDEPNSIEIDPGIAFVNLLSGELKTPYRITNLTPNSLLYLFCTVTGATQKTRRLKFFTSEAPSHSSSVRVSRIQTVGSEVKVVDNTYRDEISFRKTIQDEIAAHRHVGSPSKIDLSREVRNQLPGARIGNLDVDQIRSGRFGVDRIPQLDHKELKNTGLLSHSSLDSLAKNLQISNRQILGEVASVNLLRQHLFDTTSSADFLNSAINTVSVIPNKTPDNYIDYDASTVVFNDDEEATSGCIDSTGSSGSFLGRTATVSKIFDIKYDDNLSFNLAYDKDNIIISQDSITLALGVDFNIPVEQFEGVSEGGVAYPGVSIEETNSESNISVVSDASIYVQGLYSGKFSSGSTSKIAYKKTVTQDNDWSQYEILSIKVKCSSASHPLVSFAFSNVSTDGEETLSEKFSILSTDETTSNIDPTQNNFKNIQIDISSFDRGNINAIYFYVPDSYENFSFNIDDIGLATTAKYVPLGFAKFRYGSGSAVVLNTVMYDSSSPEDTAIELRLRTGNSILELEQAEWSGILTSGAELNLSGVEFEVEAVLKSDPEGESTPTLNSITMRFLISGQGAGFIISDVDSFLLGDLENAQINQNFSGGSSYISILTPIEVSDMYYVHANAIHQVTPDFDVSYGYGGVTLPISPRQAINYSSSISNTGIDGAVSTKRLINKNYLISDTYNDRVLEVDRNYQLVRGYGSHYAGTNAGFFPMSAIFNPRTGVLQICLSQEAQIDPSSFNLTGINIHVGDSIINLSSRDELLQRDVTRRIIEIKLSPDKQSEIGTNTQDVFVELSPGIFFIEEFANVDAFSFLYTYRGLKVDVVDFTYIDGIIHPVCVSKSDHYDRWYVANSGIPFDRIRAGLRDDSDEFFTIPDQPINFSIIVSLSDDLRDAGAVVTFMNDNNSSGNIPVEVSPPYSSDISVSTKSNLRAEVVTTPSEEDLINGPTFLLTFTIKVEVMTDGELVEVDQSPYIMQKRLTVLSDFTGGDISYPDIPSLIRLDLESDNIDFSYGGIESFTFNDFTIGSVEEIDSDKILVSGIAPFDSGTEPPLWGEPDSFEGQAIELLNDFHGKVMLLSVNTENALFNYNSPDGLYASDANFDDNSNIIVAESSIIKNVGRIIKIDPFGNIVAVYSGGQFTVVNDAKSSGNGNILVST